MAPTQLKEPSARRPKSVLRLAFVYGYILILALAILGTFGSKFGPVELVILAAMTLAAMYFYTRRWWKMTRRHTSPTSSQ
jgi:hypothetical protein